MKSSEMLHELNNFDRIVKDLAEKNVKSVLERLSRIGYVSMKIELSQVPVLKEVERKLKDMSEVLESKGWVLKLTRHGSISPSLHISILPKDQDKVWEE